MILSASEVSILSPCTASVGTIIAGKYIEAVQETICYITNNFFCSDIYLQDSLTFYPSVPSVIATGSNFATEGFSAGDDIYFYSSYRNDGVQTIESVVGSTINLVSGSTIYEELSGRSIMVSVVQWPVSIKKIAARMVAFDIDYRPKMSSGLTSRSIGPLSESWSGGFDEFGYPSSITSLLSKFTIARFM